MKYILVTLVVLLANQLNGQNCSVNSGVHQSVCANGRLFLQGSFVPPIKVGEQVTWTQIAGPAVTIVDPTNLTTEVVNLIPGNDYTFRIHVICEDGALTYQDVTHTVNPITIAQAGSDAIYCPGAVASLSANSPGAGETGAWSGGGSGVSVVNANDPNSALSITGNGSGAVTLRWTITNPNGCSSYDEVVITNRGGLNPVSAGPDQMLSHCYSATQSTSLAGSYGGSGIDGQIGTWTIVSGPNIPVFSNIHANNSSVSGLIEGVYVFRWTVNGLCLSGSDEVQITVPASTANVTTASVSGGNQVFCSNVSSTILAGAIPQYVNETVSWTLTNQTGGGAISIVSPNSPITEITGLQSPNTYTFRYTINNAVTNCSSSATVTVSYYPDAPFVNIITTDPILLSCGINTTTINYNAGGSGVTQYRIVSGPGAGYPTSWLNTTNSGAGNNISQQINGLDENGTYVVQMRRASTEGSASACGTVYDEITIISSVLSETANAGTDQLLDCNVAQTDLIGNTPVVGEGTWSQVSGPIVIILTDPHSPQLRITGLNAAGLYVFRWIISGGPNCVASQDDVFVRTGNLTPNARSAGDDQTVCYDTPLYLDAQPTEFAYEIGSWSVVPNAGVVFSDVHNPKAVVTGLLPNTSYTFTWKVENRCGDQTDDMVVDVINTLGPIVADAGPDAGECLASGTTSITLAGNDPAPGNGLWTQISGPPATIANNTQPNTSVTGLVDGTYKFKWEIFSGGCNPTRDTITVTIDAPVTSANAGNDLFVCGTTATLNPTGIAPAKGTGKWSQISGPGWVLFDGDDDPATWTQASPALSNLQEGVYVFRYTITNGVCKSTDDVSVFVSIPPSPAVIPLASTTVCGESFVTLVADPITSGTGRWTIVNGPNTPSIVSSSSASTLVNGLITGAYTFRWTVSGGPFCPVETDEITVSVTQRADAGADQSYCTYVTAVNLRGTTASAGTWEQVGVLPNAATVTATAGNTAIASNLIPGVYTFRYTISTPGCTTSDEMTVTLLNPPSTAIAGDDQEHCDAAIFTMNASAPVFGTGTWSKLSGPAGGTFSNVNDPKSSFSGAVPGIYVFQWTVANGNCSNTDQVRIVNFAEPSDAVAGPDQDINCTSSATMAATSVVNGIGMWSFVSKEGDGPAPTIVNPLLYNTVITGLGAKSNGTPEVYTFRWTTTNGVCSSKSDDVKITVFQSPTPANAGVDQSLCDATSVSLSATPVVVGAGTWTMISPVQTTEVFSDIHLATATVDNLIPGTTYVFRWTSVQGPCNSSDDVTVITYAEETDATTTPVVKCLYETVNLTGNTPLVGTGLWTKVTANSAVIVDPESPTSAVVGLPVGVHTFRWTITNGTCLSNSEDVNVEIKALPSLADAGANQLLCNNSTSATLAGNVPAVGTGTWTYVSGPGATIADPSLNNSSVTGLAEGTHIFRWTVTNTACDDYYDDVVIVRSSAMVVNGPVANSTLCEGGTQTLTVSVSGGTGIASYKWQSSPNGVDSWTDIPGAVNASYTTPALGAGNYYYHCVVTQCSVITSAVAHVQVVSDPTIVIQPAGTTMCAGSTHAMSVTATGGYPSLNYIWESSPNGTDSWSTVYVGANNNYTTPALTKTTYYRVTVYSTGTGCSPVSSSVVAVNVPSVISQSSPAYICAGGTASDLNIVVDAAGSTLAYQWESSTNLGGPYSNVGGGAGANTDTYDTEALATTTYFRCRVTVTAPNCADLYSSPIKVTVNNDPQIAVQPVGATICSGENKSLTVTAFGGVPIPSYQWQYFDGIAFVNGATASGATTSTYITPNLTADTRFRVIVSSSGAGCGSETSSEAIVKVNNLDGGAISDNQTICSATVPAAFSSVSDATGDGVITYQWQSSTDNVTFGNIATETNSIYTPAGALTADTWYRRVATSVLDGVSCSVNSNTVKVTVNNFTSANTINGQIICSGSSAVISGNNVTADGAVTYLWEESDDDGVTDAWTVIGGATSASYTTPALAADRYFRRTALSTIGASICDLVSASVLVQVNSFTTLNTISGTQTICSGSTASLTGNAVVGNGVITYQWQRGLTEFGTYNDISGATNQDYTSTALTADAWYRRIAINTTGATICTLTSTPVLVTVNNVTSGTIASDQTICSGGAPNPFTETVAATGDGVLTYLWQSSTDNFGTNVTDVGTNSTYSPGVLVQDTWYRRIVTSTIGGDPVTCTATSSTIKVTVVSSPSITSQPTASISTICVGGTTNLTIAAAGGTPSRSYQWQYDTGGGSWANVTNGTPAGATYTILSSGTQLRVASISAIGAYSYRCIVSSTGLGCNDATSNNVNVTVVADPVLTDPTYTRANVCAGGSTVVSSTISGGTGVATYRWQYYNGTTWGNTVNGTPAGASYSGQTSLSMTISGITLAGTHQYRLTTTNTSGCDYNSSGASFTVVADPLVTTQPVAPAAICVGGTSANMSVVATGGTPSLDYQWEYNNSGTWAAVVNGLPLGATYSNATQASDFSVAGISNAGAYEYRCKISATGDGCGTVYSETRTLTVVADPSITTPPASVTICNGSTTTLNVVATGGTPSLNYQWESSPSGMNTWSNVGANSASYTTPALAANTDYRVTVTATGNDCNPITSAVATVTVNNLDAGIIAASQTICSGHAPASLSSTNDATATEAGAVITYRWERSTDNVTYNTIAGQTNTTYAPSALYTTTYYRRVAISTLNGVVCERITVPVTINVNPTPTVTSASTKSICNSENVNYTPTSAVVGTTYAWTAVNTVGTVTGFTPNGSGAIDDVLTNAGMADGQVTYVITPTNVATGCVGPDFSLVITVINCAPKIGVAKQLVSLEDKGDGTYEALFNIRVQNYGNQQLDDIQVTDDLVTAFGATNYTVLGISSANFAVNTSFNGNADKNLLVSAGNSLARDASSDIRLRVRILAAGSYTNQVTATSVTGGVSDVSHNGSDPDPDHDGDVAEHSTPTPLNTNCVPVVSVTLTDGAMCHPNHTFNQTYSTNAVIVNASSYLWSTDGTGTFSSTTVMAPTYTPSASDVQDGQVRLKVVAYSGGVCPNVEKEMILTIWTPPTVNAGPNGTVCAGNTHTLSGAVAYNYTDLTWVTVEAGRGSFNNDKALNPVYTPNGADITAGSVTLRLTAKAEGTCVDVSDDVVLTFTPALTVNAGTDADICSSGTHILAGTATNYTSVLWTTSGTGSFGGAQATLNPTYTPSAADKLTGQVQLTLTATSSCGTVSDVKVLNIWPVPTANAGPATATICAGSSYTLTGAVASDYSTLQWAASGAVTGTFDNANALNPVFTPTTGQSGTVRLTLTATKIGTSCSDATDFIDLSVIAAPVISITGQTNTACGQSTGAISLASGGVNGTFNLNGTTIAGTTATYNNLIAGHYQVSFTSAAGCTATKDFEITNTNSNLSATVSFTDPLCYGGTTTATITASGGTAPYTYKLNGVAVGSNVIANLTAGAYVALVTDANGCTFSLSFDIDQPTRLEAQISSKSNVSCHGGTDGTATVVATGGTTTAVTGYTYLWSNGQTTATATGLSAGVAYTVTVRDANNCTAIASVTLTEPSALGVTLAGSTSPTCHGGNDGQISINVSGGTSPYSFVWNNGSSEEDPDGLTGGTYNVTVTDSHGCQATLTNIVLTDPAAVTITASNLTGTVCNGSNGSVRLTSSDGSTITVGSTTLASGSTFTNLSAGYYTATSNGVCPASLNFNIVNTNSNLSATVSFTDPLCYGGTTTATITASGGTAPYTYKLNGVAVGSNVIANLTAGAYVALVTDANGCTFSLSFDIDQPTRLEAQISSKANVSCHGGTDGTATVVATGGTTTAVTGYTYLWSNGQTTATATGLSAGVAYTVTVRDANNCTAIASVTLTEPSALSVTLAGSTSPTCHGGNDGQISINVSGGTSPYSSVWNNGSSEEDPDGLTGGTYNVTVTDSHGCQATLTNIVLTDPAAVTITATNLTGTACNGYSGSVRLTSSDGSTITVGSTTLASGSTFTNLSAGYYTATSNGVCSASLNFNIVNTNSNLSGTVTSRTNVGCKGNNTGAVVIVAANGLAPYTYSLKGAAPQASGSFSGLSAGDYWVRITDANSCTYVVSFVIEEPTLLVLAKTSQTDVSCLGMTDGALILTGQGGSTPYAYTIITQPVGGTATISANVVSGMKAGTYLLRITDANSCTADLSVTINQTLCTPDATNDNAVTNEDNATTGNVLINDTDPNGLPLSVTQFTIGGITYAAGNLATIPNVGTIRINIDGSYTFTPSANYNGTVPVITYTASNGTSTDTAELTITVVPGDDSPVAADDAFTTNEGTSFTGSVAGTIGNPGYDTPSGDGGNIWTVVTPPTHGSVVINADGTFTYSPVSNYVGADAFTYKVCDVDGDCSSATVTMTIGNINDAPVISDVPKTGSEDSDVTFTTNDFITKYTDADGDPMTKIKIVSLPANGVLRLNGNPVVAGTEVAVADIPNLRFTPNANWNGNTSFDWNAFDGVNYAATAEQVNINVLPVNDPPVAGTATMLSQINPGGTNTVQVYANNFSGTDIDGTISNIRIMSMPTNATSITVDGVKYTSIPGAGVSITTNATGQPLFSILIDPVDGAVTSVLSYYVVDNESMVSAAAGSVTIPFTGLVLSGTVYNDGNGLADNTVNGVGTNVGGALYMNLVNTLNQVVASVPIAANGTYSFTEANGLNINSTYKLILSTGIKVVGSTLSAASYPAGWSSAGENIGAGVGSDGTAEGVLAVNTNGGSLANANFGITGSLTLFAGNDAVICSFAGSYTLQGTASNYSSVLWTTNGTGSFINPAILNAVYIPSSADIATKEVQLKLTVTGAGSSVPLSDEMTLTIWPSATAYAGIDHSVCRTDSYQILDAHVTNAESILWTKNAGATGTLTGATTLTPVYTPAPGETGTITLTLTVTPFGGGTCSTVSDTKLLTITDPPTVVLGPDINNCALNPTTLTGIAANYSSLDWSSSGTGVFSANNALVTTYTPSVADINYAQVTIRLTARGNGSCPSVTDELVLKVWRNTYAFAGNDVSVCNGEPYQVLDAEATDYVGLIWTHNGTGTLTNPTTLSPIYTPGIGETGPVTLTLTVTPEGSGVCPTYHDDKVITVSGPPVVTCPAGGPFVFANTAGVNGYVVSNNSLDATAVGCGGNVTVTHNFSAWANPYSLNGATLPIGTTTIVWTARDGHGNTSTCTTTVQVNDTEAPEFVNCPSGKTFTIGTMSGSCKGGAIWSIPVLKDNGTNATAVQTKGPQQGTLLDTGMYEIEYTAVDGNGNSSVCSFFINVVDTENPFLVCPSNIQKETDKGKCSWISQTNNLSVMLSRSNCSASLSWLVTNPDGTSVSGINDVSGYEFQKGISTVQYFIVDGSSAQQTSCTFTVTVVDREAPVLERSVPVTETTTPGTCVASLVLTPPSFKDNCSAVPSKVNYMVFNPDNSFAGPFDAGTAYNFMAGISRVEWSFWDAALNMATSLQMVTIKADASAMDLTAGFDANICEGEVYKLINASAKDYTSLLWATKGSGKFSDKTQLNPIYIPSLADILNGDVELTLTASSTCAITSSSMVLTIARKAVVKAGSTSSVTVCAGSSYELKDASQSNAVSLQWISSGSGTFSDDKVLHPIYTPGSADLLAGRVTLTLTANSATPCGVASDAIELILIPQTTANAGPDVTICEGSNYSISGAKAANQSLVKWRTSGTGIFSNPGVLSPTYYPSTSDILNGKVILTLSALGKTPCGTTEDEMELTIQQRPIAKAGADEIACANEQFRLNQPVAQHYSSIFWTTSGKGQIQDATTLRPTYIPARGEVGMIQMIMNVHGFSFCNDEIVRDTMLISYHPEMLVDAGESETVLYNRSAILSSSVYQGSGAYVYSWSPVDMVPNHSSNRAETVRLKADTWFNLIVSDMMTGCQATDSVLIVVDKNIDNLIEIRNGLSPNGDGDNDVWWIDGIEKFPDNYVKIFNRWGDRVRELEDYDNENIFWDGTNDEGKRLPDGTYYYVLEIKNVKSYTGWVQLKNGK